MQNYILVRSRLPILVRQLSSLSQKLAAWDFWFSTFYRTINLKLVFQGSVSGALTQVLFQEFQAKFSAEQNEAASNSKSKKFCYVFNIGLSLSVHFVCFFFSVFFYFLSCSDRSFCQANFAAVKLNRFIFVFLSACCSLNWSSES